MSMQYQFIQGEYKYWNPEIKIPTKKTWIDKETGELRRYYLTKEQDWSEVNSYWAYKKVGDCYELYRRYKNGNSRLVETNMHLTPDAVLWRICERFYKVSDCDRAEEHHGVIGPKTSLATIKWSEELDGKSIVILLTRYPKMTYGEIMMVLQNERATVDAQGIIHKAER